MTADDLPIPTATDRLGAAQALALASRALVRLARVRGAGRRTQARVAGAGALMLAAAALLNAAPAAGAMQPHYALLPFGQAFQAPIKPALVDLDGDGFAELVVALYAGNVLTFGPDLPALSMVGLAPRPAFADIDGDGDFDAFVGVRTGETFFFANTGTAAAPAFAAPIANPFGLANAFLFSAPAFADIDDDGDLDAFLGSLFSRIDFFANTGSDTSPAFAFVGSNQFGLAALGQSSAPTLFDIDDDGDLDGFVGHADGEIAFFANTGTAAAPAFASPTTPPFGLDVDADGAVAIAFGDFDRDGDVDAVLGDGVGRLGLLFRVAPPQFGPATATPFAHVQLSRGRPVFGDLDGDGDLDALVGENYGDLVLLRHNGDAGFSLPTFGAAEINPFGLANLGRVTTPALADLDGDGDLDALVGEYGGDLFFLHNTGSATDPAFATASVNPFGLSQVGSNPCPTLADLDGDDDLDLFVGLQSGNTAFFRNTGSAAAPQFAAEDENPFGLADVGGAGCPAFADLDFDGDLDAFLGETLGDTISFENTGSALAPAFAAPIANPLNLANVGFGSRPTFADLDGDLDLDAVIGSAGGEIVVFENQPRVPLPPTATPTEVQSETATATPTATDTPTATGTATATGTTTASRTATATATVSPSATPSATPTPSVTGTAPATLSPTAGAPPTATPTEAPSGTPTDPIATPTATAGSPCAGDCDQSGEVNINELIRAVNIALGSAPIAECASLDVNADGAVDISELIRAVGNGLASCAD
jgi:hypothetical protein